MYISFIILPATLHGSAYLFLSFFCFVVASSTAESSLVYNSNFLFFSCCFNKNKSTHSPDILLTGAGFLEQVSCVFPACPTTPSSKITVHILADVSISI